MAELGIREPGWFDGAALGPSLLLALLLDGDPGRYLGLLLCGLCAGAAVKRRRLTVTRRTLDALCPRPGLVHLVHPSGILLAWSHLHPRRLPPAFVPPWLPLHLGRLLRRR